MDPPMFLLGKRNGINRMALLDLIMAFAIGSRGKPTGYPFGRLIKGVE